MASIASVMKSSPAETLPLKVDATRILVLKPDSLAAVPAGKCVLYWMNRDMRIPDNWALLHAQELALAKRIPLRICYCLVPEFFGTLRHLDFAIGGLKQVEEAAVALQIPFHLLEGPPAEVLLPFVQSVGVATLVTDFRPLRHDTEAVCAVTDALPQGIGFVQVDAHNVVPIWKASDKQENSARAIRPKITPQLPRYLTPFPSVREQPTIVATKGGTVTVSYGLEGKMVANVPWDEVYQRALAKVDESVKICTWLEPGTKGAIKLLEKFCNHILPRYAANRNDPTEDALSNISAHIRYGNISAQATALHVKQVAGPKYKESVESFIEELIIRREVADNFCNYNQQYDSIDGARDWAKETLARHASDPRPYLYTLEEFETGKTHDVMWNAAQMQMVNSAKMHGYMRMYWAKKILEWSPTPEEALKWAIMLNDKYSLDGKCPNGFVGVMWSICGIHDMGWPERPVFGKIRCMTFSGCNRKFDIVKFVQTHNPAETALAVAAKRQKGVTPREQEQPPSGEAAKPAKSATLRDRWRQVK